MADNAIAQDTRRQSFVWILVLAFLSVVITAVVVYQGAQSRLEARFRSAVRDIEVNLEHTATTIGLVSRLTTIESALRYGVTELIERVLNQVMVQEEGLAAIAVYNLEGDRLASNTRDSRGVFTGTPQVIYEFIRPQYEFESRVTPKQGEIGSLATEDLLAIRKRILVEDEMRGELIAFLNAPKLLSDALARAQIPSYLQIEIRRTEGFRPASCEGLQDFFPKAFVCADFSFASTIRSSGYDFALSFLILALCWALILALVNKQTEEWRRRAEVQNALVRLARQVSHDIRSPLAALHTGLSGLKESPEDIRMILERAVVRIQDIANNLLTQSSDQQVDLDDDEPELIYALVEMIVSEKRLQFRDRVDLQFQVKAELNSRIAFARVQAREFKRMISNLLDNAVEASRGRNDIVVSMTIERKLLEICVADQGIGMSADIRRAIESAGGTYNKQAGLGLGLSHARTRMKEWCGELKIDSEEGRGTTIRLFLPLCPVPSEILTRISVPKGARVFVIDDDASIFSLWKKRFQTFLDQGQIQEIRWLEDFELWPRECQTLEDGAQVLVLMDYQFRAKKQTGLDALVSYGLKTQGVLVTSHFDHLEVRHECLRQGIRLLPKLLCPSIEIEIET